MQLVVFLTSRCIVKKTLKLNLLMVKFFLLQPLLKNTGVIHKVHNDRGWVSIHCFRDKLLRKILRVGVVNYFRYETPKI